MQQAFGLGRSLLSACLFWQLSGAAAWAQHASPLDELFYPGASQQRLTYSQGQTVHAQISPHTVQTVLLHYLKLSRQTPWQLTFPSGLEAQAWLAGLAKNPSEEPVFMLSLYNTKSDINFNLTIGGLPNTSPTRARSIITLYSTRRPFGGRQGG